MNTLDNARKLVRVGVMASAVVLMAGAGLTFASNENSSSNFLTGPYSLNKNITEIEDKVEVKLINELDVDNDLDYYFNTGKNEVEKNTKVGDIRGGDINAVFALSSGLGSVSGSSSYNFGQNYSYLAADPTLSNAVTGPCSENINVVKIETERELKVINKTDIDNDIDIKANTGYNEVEKNTVVGDISTGDINIQGTINNSNGAPCVDCEDVLAIFNGSASTSLPEVSASNSTTGPDSKNVNIFKSENKVEALIVNDTEIDNDVDVDANTGKNEVECNTVVGDISTGDVSVSIGISN